MLSVVVGLGNPGREYEGTRHNIGFEILDYVAAKRLAHWKYEGKWQAEAAQTNFGTVEGPGARGWLLKPQTYMNLSGEALRAFFKWHKLGAESLLVVVDDVALPLGRLRLRKGGSSGGHHGLDSIQQHLGTDQFARLRCGIGSVNGEGDLSRHVLERFHSIERPAVTRMIERAADAVECACIYGVEAAMNRYNQNTHAPDT